MKRRILVLTAGLLSLGVNQNAKAGLIAEWQFNAYGGGDLVNYNPEYGIQSSTANAAVTTNSSSRSS
jgi:hypothetical protein